ncbi:MAG: hypothetical protein PHX80_04195 [Candidatus Nanoarchaeia archaeon]|nr:hypothetical protein [Candidatus Nanoarchaeia archaeon]
MEWRGHFREVFLDIDGAFNMLHLISFVTLCLGVELINVGLVFMFIDSAGPGMAIIGFGSGLLTGGGLMKIVTKDSEISNGNKG